MLQLGIRRALMGDTTVALAALPTELSRWTTQLAELAEGTSIAHAVTFEALLPHEATADVTVSTPAKLLIYVNRRPVIMRSVQKMIRERFSVRFALGKYEVVM